jgi:hypothetical protein
LFSIAKLLAEQTYISEDLSELLNKISKWEQFITKDVMNYEKEMNQDTNGKFLEYVKKMSNSSAKLKKKETDREKY